jgi:hypothetical protein
VYRGQFWRVAPALASIVADAQSSVPRQVEATPERVDAPAR